MCLRAEAPTQVHVGRRRAKGGIRTPTAFRLPDPKSGASASSATFARGAAGVRQKYAGFGRQPDLRVARLPRAWDRAAPEAVAARGSATLVIRYSSTCPRLEATALIARRAGTL